MDQKTNRTNEANKKTALRLCNKYAEEYKSLELQLNSYKMENNDLRTNIQVQKEIINSFFTSQPFDTKSKLILTKQKEEIDLLTNQLCEMAKRITKEREYYSLMKNKIELSFSVVEKENERIKNDNFILDNLLQEKVALIEKMKRNLRINANNSKIEIKETYITNPKTIINSLNNELCFYKEKNQSLINEIEKMKKDISTRDKSIKQLERIITKYNINSNTVTYDKPSNPKLDDITTANNKLSKSESNIFIKQLESFKEINKLKTKEYDYKKEWIDILKSCSVSANEYLSYSNDPQMKKLCDIIEFLFKTLIEKNNQLSLVFKENESLNQANIKINKRNIELTTKLGEFAFNNIQSSKSTNSTIVPSYNDESYIKTTTNNIFSYKFNNTSESVTSSEFNNGIVIDLFELESEMSIKNSKTNYNTKGKASEVSSNNEDSVHIKI